MDEERSEDYPGEEYATMQRPSWCLRLEGMPYLLFSNGRICTMVISIWTARSLLDVAGGGSTAARVVAGRTSREHLVSHVLE